MTRPAHISELAPRMPPGSQLPPPDGVGELRNYLTDNRAFMIWSIVRNNPYAIAEKLGIQDPSVQELYDLVMAMDRQEQDDIILVNYITGLDLMMDGAFAQIINAIHEQHLDIPEPGEPDRFITLAVAAISAGVAIYNQSQQRHAAEAANNAAALAAYEAEQQRLAAAANARAKKERLKKILPWAGAGIIILGIIIYRLVR